jgi:hypothetical protein
MKTRQLLLAVLGVRMKTGVALRSSYGTGNEPIAGLLAMVVNDNAGKPDKHGALESIASKPAPTGIVSSVIPGIDAVFCRSRLAGDGRQQ